MADRTGQQFGNYRLVALLGQGGYAEVYLGQHLRLNQQAAIKVLHAHLTETEAEHFQQEAQTIATLTHPGIVRVFDYDVQEGVPFLVMDYAPNGTLRRRYPRGSLVPLAVIVSAVKQVADALQYAHEQKFIHRDVKPENMLLGRREEVLLSDFGIATLAQSTSSLMRVRRRPPAPWPTWPRSRSRGIHARPVISMRWGWSSTNGCVASAPLRGRRAR